MVIQIYFQLILQNTNKKIKNKNESNIFYRNEYRGKAL